MLANKTINSFLKLNTNEAKLLLLLFGCDLFRRVASLMLETASSSIFLFEFLGTHLPTVFILTAVFMVLASAHFIKIKTLPSAAAALTLMGLSAITFLLYLFYGGHYAEEASMALMVWKNICVLLSEITFLLVAMKFCKYDWQSWRFIGILLTEATAMVISGLAVTVLVFYITPQTIIALSSVLLFVAGLMLYALSSKLDSKRPLPDKYNVKGIRNVPKQFWLVASFFTMLAVFVFAGYIIEYLFYKSVYARYGAEWLSDMTAFFAMYHVFAGMLVFVMVGLFWHFAWLRGIKCTFITLPFFIVIGAAGCLTLSLLLLSFSRMGKDVIYRLVMTPTAKFFTVPLLPHLSKRLSAVRRLAIEPLSILAAGLFLYKLDSALTMTDFARLLFICTGVLALLAYISYRIYISVTRDSLESHYWWGGKLFLEDKSLQGFIEQQVLNPDVEDTIYYLRVLENSYGVDLKSALIFSLNHHSEKVRLFALGRLQEYRFALALPAVLNLIESDSSVAVRNKAVETYCVLGGQQTFSYIAVLLNNEQLQKGAITGLLKTSAEGAFIAAGNIARLISSGNKEDKLTVCEILGNAGIKEYYRPLLKLMYDKDNQVQKKAVTAAGKLKNPLLAPDLVACLMSLRLREEAAEGILNLGEGALPYLSDLLNNEDAEEVTPKVIALIGQIGGNEAQDILLQRLKYACPSIKVQILKILSLKEYRFRYVGADIFTEVLKSEIQRKGWLAATLDDVSSCRGAKLSDAEKSLGKVLEEALNQEIKQSSLIIELAKKQLNHTLDIPVPFALSPAVCKEEDGLSMPLLNRLMDIITSADGVLHEWTRACAVYYAGVLKAKFLTKVLEETMENNKNCLVKETTLWALSQVLSEDEAKRTAKKYLKDECENVAHLAHSIAD